jgi:HKD family nuclease
MIRYHIISEEETFGYRLKSCLENCHTAFIATAFLTKSAVIEIEEQLRTALNNEAHITLLIGRYEYVTEPLAIRKLLAITKAYKGKKGSLQVFFDSDYGFHFKLALFKNSNSYTTIIGSSNLTGKGLSSKGENNLEIENHKGLYNFIEGENR